MAVLAGSCFRHVSKHHFEPPPKESVISPCKLRSNNLFEPLLSVPLFHKSMNDRKGHSSDFPPGAGLLLEFRAYTPRPQNLNPKP